MWLIYSYEWLSCDIFSFGGMEKAEEKKLAESGPQEGRDQRLLNRTPDAKAFIVECRETCCSVLTMAPTAGSANHPRYTLA